MNESAGNLFHSLTREKKTIWQKVNISLKFRAIIFFKNEFNGIYVTDRDLDGWMEIKLARQTG